MALKRALPWFERAKDSVAELAWRDGPGLEQKLIGQCALPMIDVRNDAEIANKFRVGHGLQHLSPGRKPRWGRITRSTLAG